MTFVIPTGVYHGTHPIDALILDDFDRAAPNGTGSAKVGGNYAPVFRHAEKAKSMGYGITLHLDAKISLLSSKGMVFGNKADRRCTQGLISRSLAPRDSLV